MTIAVMGCVRTLPEEFPVEKPENSGNMIHGNAPFEMFEDLVFQNDTEVIKHAGAKSFIDFVNENASHLILTLANTLRIDDPNPERYLRLKSTLEKVKKPIVVFGLGIQAQEDVSARQLQPEAISLLETILERTNLLGVRGEMTRQVIRNSVSNAAEVAVTGCPSLFSRPEHLANLRTRPAEEKVPAFNGTKLHFDNEKTLLENAIREGHFIVEPVNKFNHIFYESLLDGRPVEVPYFLKRLEKRLGSNGGKIISDHFLEKYRLFRDPRDWYSFNLSSVNYTYGTRFHANMASILSGVPAVWVTHDARTQELTEFMNLPAVPIEKVERSGHDVILESLDYTKFFREIEGLFANFNHYLGENGLPSIKTPKDYSSGTADPKG